MTRPAAARDLVPHLILRRAAARPGAIAVVAGDQEVDYRTLVARATAVAAELVEAGAGPDQVIGLAAPRSVNGLAGMLGILLSGAAYLYLDPTLPPPRAHFMRTECDVTITIDTRVDHGQTRDISDSPMARLSMINAGRLAYVVYTSGSTGVPKGVAVEHGGVANMVRRLADVFGVTAGTRVLQFASWSWDASACEILVTLAAGGTLVLAPDGVRRDGTGLASLLRAARVEVATLTPSVLALLPPDELPDLRTVAAVGETCPPALVSRWAGRRFLNGYGPTEATVAVSVGECHPDAEVHIGAPLPGVRVRVVDNRDRSVLPGRPGHLLVGGAGLARGYIGASPSDGRFVTDGRGTRWFRTGDRVRQRADGTMVHLGRFDDQVQVHGYRVELGEVEATLRRDPAVASCAATVQGGRLVAYVVPHGAVEPAALVGAARDWLPAHMVPEIRLVAALPLTANGKVDRPALGSPSGATGHGAAPDAPSRDGRALGAASNAPSQGGRALGSPSGAVGRGTASDAPSQGGRQGPAAAADPILADVLAVVRGVLETDQVGPDDDVFDLGGHSLLAAELSVAISARFGLEVSALAVVDHPTPGRLATVIRGGTS